MPPLGTATHLSIHGSSFTEIHGDATYHATGNLNLHVPRPYESGQPRIPIVSSEIDPPIPRRTHEALPGIGKGCSP